MRLAVLFMLGCAHSTASTVGLGEDCTDDAECAEGQSCHSYAHHECPDAQCRTCEVTCTGHSDCPAGLRCNLPPLVPDTVPNVCE